MAYSCGDIGTYLAGKSYPGRGILLGLSPSGGKAMAAYFIMGRSANSRNRIFRFVGGDQEKGLETAPFDSSRLQDPTLIIYRAAFKSADKKAYIVTNGNQTDSIYDALAAGLSFEDALQSRCFEEDGPNFTPRISGLLEFPRTGTAVATSVKPGEAALNPEPPLRYRLSVLKAEEAEGRRCRRSFYRFEGLPGRGHIVHTYVDDGDPLQPYEGEPRAVFFPEREEDLLETIWANLNEKNRISLYVYSCNLTTGEERHLLRNRHC